MSTNTPTTSSTVYTDAMRQQDQRKLHLATAVSLTGVGCTVLGLVLLTPHQEGHSTWVVYLFPFVMSLAIGLALLSYLLFWRAGETHRTIIKGIVIDHKMRLYPLGYRYYLVVDGYTLSGYFLRRRSIRVPLETYLTTEDNTPYVATPPSLES